MGVVRDRKEETKKKRARRNLLVPSKINQHILWLAVFLQQAQSFHRSVMQKTKFQYFYDPRGRKTDSVFALAHRLQELFLKVSDTYPFYRGLAFAFQMLEHDMESWYWLSQLLSSSLPLEKTLWQTFQRQIEASYRDYRTKRKAHHQCRHEGKAIKIMLSNFTDMKKTQIVFEDNKHR